MTAAGPRVVALGGGHGLANTLRAARRYAGAVTAVVSVADDGGSSGRLREALGIPAPGDLRRCLSALADPHSRWAGALEHRFAHGELEGHALGNLMIAGLADAMNGGGEAALVDALDEIARLVGAAGRVLPATCEPVVLRAETAGDGPAAPGSAVEGQVAVSNTRSIARVSLAPADPRPPAAVLDAIAGADQVVLGPGSLFTSVLAASIIPAIRDALAATSARRIYVCNLREQVPETEGYSVAAHLDALAAHGIGVDVALVDRGGGLPRGEPGVPVEESGVARPDGLAHDPERLAIALAGLVG